LAGDAEVHETLTIKCAECGAESVLPPDTTADICPFCGSAIVATAASHKAIKPNCLLPFAIPKQRADAEFKDWLASRWFAPSSLKKTAQGSALRGVYIPAWTYDCDTRTEYDGERGDDSWDTETYTEMVNGKPVTRTRQVLKTRWHSVSGSVDNRFDDLLVLATRSLPMALAQRLEPWDLPALAPYADEYLGGFRCESYQVTLNEGFQSAQTMMQPEIRRAIDSDIGGDHQRIGSTNTGYYNIGFRHALLPVWISAYRYAGKTWRFLVNARTGEVQGQRPYSAIKIILAILTAVVIALVVWLLLSARFSN
jgi:hypothetical protein